MIVLLWMALIFGLSSQPAHRSNGLSQGLTKFIVDIVHKIVPKIEFDIGEFNHILRKNAHFFAYLALGILVLNALRRSGLSRPKALTLALGICVLYAISDEVHQLYVPGRGGQAKDVLIDSAGTTLGLTTYWIINRFILVKR